MLAAGDVGQTFAKAAVKHRNREALAVFAAQRFLQTTLSIGGRLEPVAAVPGFQVGSNESCLRGNL